MPVNAVTLARILHDHGYQTAAFVSAIVLDSRFGLNAGFDTYFDRFDTARADATDQSANKRSGDDTVDVALSWLQQHAGSAATPSPQPFFIWVHLFDPHRPYNAPEPYATRYRTNPYDSEIAFDDAEVGRLEAELQQRGLWKDALVVLTADHGEGLGEHGEEGHGFFIYNSTLHVPLLIHLPQVSPRVVDSGVSLVDVMPTVLQALRIAVPPSVQGRSVLDLALGQVSNSDSIFYSESYLPLLHFGWSALRGLQVQGLKYIDAPQPELYVVDSDPHELMNLYSVRLASGHELHRELFSDLRRLTPRAATTTVEQGPADPALLEQLRSLGYVEASPHRSHQMGAPSLADPKDRIQVYQSYLRAASDSEHGRYDASLAELRSAEKADPTSPFIAYLQGLDYYRLREYVKAKLKFRAALDLDPSFTLALYYLGRAQFQLADLDAAISSLEYVLAEDGTNFTAVYHLGEAYVKKGRLGDGVESFRKAIGLKPDYAPATRHWARHISSRSSRNRRQAL